MNGFRFMLVVARRSQSEAFIDFFKRHGVGAVFLSLCEGTAKKKTLDILGLEPREKIMLSALVSSQTAQLLSRRFITQMHIDAPDTGIALTLYVDGISGQSALQSLCGHQPEANHVGSNIEVKEMKDHPYSLIIAIADKGHCELVMDAARSGGASGGTLIHAREVGANPTSKFFGVSIAEEKSKIFIVVPSTKRDSVLEAIMDKAGIHSPAHAVAFSLPLENAVGLADPIDEDYLAQN